MSIYNSSIIITKYENKLNKMLYILNAVLHRKELLGNDHKINYNPFRIKIFFYNSSYSLLF